MSAIPVVPSMSPLAARPGVARRVGGTVRTWLLALRRRSGAATTMVGAVAGAMLLAGDSQIATRESTGEHFASPMALVLEHAELHGSVEQAAQLGGQTGEAARQVLRLLDVHMAREQRHAFPLLRLAPIVASRGVEPWMGELLPLADQLRKELPVLAREHGELSFALKGLADAAWAEDHPQYALVAQRIVRHHQLEEQVLVPAALVIGDTVRTRLASSQR